MQWLQLVLTFVADIAWPVVAVVVVIVLRKEISSLLARVTKVSTPLGSLDAEARAMADDADKLDPKALVEGNPYEINLELKDPAHLGDEAKSSTGIAERDMSDLYKSAIEWSQDIPDDVEVLFSPAQRLVNVEPSEAVRIAWQAFRFNLWRLERDDVTEGMVFRGPILATLARLGFSEEFLSLVKRLEDLSVAGESLTSEGAIYYVEAAIRMASLVWFHWHEAAEHQNSG